MDYPGKVITKNAVIPTQTSAPGVWTLDDAAQAQKANSWPIPGVLNPISKSLRFNNADSTSLSRTPVTSGNQRTFTWSGWVKLSRFGATQTTGIGAVAPSGAYTYFYLTSGNALIFQDYGSGYDINWTTSAVFRDPSSWYHFVCAVDTTQASSSNAVKIYVNGVQQTVTFTASSGAYVQNRNTTINSVVAHDIGSSFGGYMTEINFVDGQALTPSDFGMTNTVTGVWVPKKYTGTYGTNGFYVNFKDSTNTTTLGYDYSGNGNNWNANNFSVTAGAGNDSLTDVPTPWVGYALNTEAGGVVRGNYATFVTTASAMAVGSITNGGLDVSTYGGTSLKLASFAVPSDKWYWEVVITGGANVTAGVIGIVDSSKPNTTSAFTGSGVIMYYGNGNKYVNGSGSAYGSSYTTNDVIGVALDMTASTITFYKNNVSQGAITVSNITNAVPFLANGDGASATNYTANFGQRPFAYTPPSGYKSLCTTNLPTPTIVQGDDYFNTVLYTGNGTTNPITGVGFQPDFTWIKRRSTADSNILYNVVAGPTVALISNLPDAELTGRTFTFDSNGFTPMAGSGAENANGQTFVAWNWKANGAGVTNTAGSITSTVSANTTSGFSIVTYTGTGSAATVGHGLGVAPSMIITKARSNTSAWAIYHVSLGATKGIEFDTAAAATSDIYWNNTAPTSTVFSVKSGTTVNASGYTYVGYCFAPVAGYSAFGSYTGNGSTDGPFVYTGFRPAYVLIKETNSGGGTSNWVIKDKLRTANYNPQDGNLYTNLSNAEDTTSTVYIDFLSNGFKIRGNYAGVNASGNTFIYACFAENPFKFANAR